MQHLLLAMDWIVVSLALLFVIWSVRRPETISRPFAFAYLVVVASIAVGHRAGSDALKICSDITTMLAGAVLVWYGISSRRRSANQLHSTTKD